jgi:hypothetical protein
VRAVHIDLPFQVVFFVQLGLVIALVTRLVPAFSIARSRLSAARHKICSACSPKYNIVRAWRKLPGGSQFAGQSFP